MTLPSSFRPHCPLYLDILEAILYEHRLDTHTLAQCALVSKTMLQLSRKALYRSVSLDQSENPYAFDQQRLLRTSLAENPHLCNQIHTLRLPLSDNPLLTRIMDQLTKVERLHVIGDSLTPGQVSTWAEQQPYHPSSAGSSSSMNGHHLRALRRLFGLTSLRKVILEGSFPFSMIDLSHSAELRDLEVSNSTWDYGLTTGKHQRPKAAHVRDGTLSFPDHELGCLPGILPSREANRKAIRLDRLSLKAKSLGPLRQLLTNGDEPVYESSDTHLSRLRELHLDICDPDDCDAIWGALRQCHSSLEALSIRHLWNDSQRLNFTGGILNFPNLTTLVLGVPAFSPTDHPFQPLLHLLSYRTSAAIPHRPFPFLGSLKVIFDLWGCEAMNMPWKTICNYRGWVELDDALQQALPSNTPHPSVTFEIQSSIRFKKSNGTDSTSEPGSLIALLQDKLPYLRRQPNFSIL